MDFEKRVKVKDFPQKIYTSVPCRDTDACDPGLSLIFFE
jgi:hypothetical protein